MPVEDFYAPRKQRYDGFYIPDQQDECFVLGLRKPHRGDIYQELWDRWQMPDECPACLAEGELVALAEAAVAIDTRPLRERFLEQANKWEQETKFVSSVTKRVSHQSYTAILGMGREPGIVEILLHDLQTNRRPWFWALSYITESNPIKPEDAGKTDKMIAAWVGWGKEKGYIR